MGTHETFSSHRDKLSKSHFDVIILGSSFTSLVLAAILSVMGRRVLILERSNSSLFGSSSKSVSCGSAATEIDLSQLYFGCCGWVFVLLCGLVNDGNPDDVLEMEPLGGSNTSPFLYVTMGNKTGRFQPGGRGSANIPAPLLEESKLRCYIGSLSMLVLKLLPRWVSTTTQHDVHENNKGWSISTKLRTFFANVLRRIHTGCTESLRLAASETSEEFVRGYADDPTLRSILSGGQSIVEGETCALMSILCGAV